MSTEPKICIDCLHYDRSGAWGGTCHRKATKRRDLIDGELVTDGVREARAERFIPHASETAEADRCGREGKHFAPKFTPPRDTVWEAFKSLCRFWFRPNR